MIFWKKKKYVPDDERLQQIIDLLYPPLKTARTPAGVKYHIDYSVDSNLDAVLMDLQEGTNDAAVQKTLNTCIKKLNQVRTILEAYAELDKEAQYLIVDDEDLDEPENIAPYKH